MTNTAWVALAVNPDLPISQGPVSQALEGIAEFKAVHIPYKKLTAEEEDHCADLLQGAYAILLRSGYITASLLAKLPDLKVIAVHGTGVDPVDVETCSKRSIIVTNTPGANADAVTELSFALMISLLRGLQTSSARAMQDKLWDEARTTGGELRGRQLGVVGFGQIGQRVATIAQAFGMKVIASDPQVEDADIIAKGAAAGSLEELLNHSDIVTLHAPATPATHHLINQRSLQTMKRGALLINCARGALVDEYAVAAALESGQLGGAALDVLAGEPPDPQSPVYQAPNFLLTPHMAGSTLECLDNVARMAAADIAAVLSNRSPAHPVN
ncbi:hypothetical protein AB833_12860 [Chromatiales bacterium (ex Bugula neritina AB1)]|nr:hypothetical protein AB833_12860 [Chromatiales bacterium (ex Bugula neritina AB1)]